MKINNSNFIVQEFEVHHPASLSYKSYWQDQKRRCIEGYWVSGKWMPGKLYFYVNMGTILKNKKNSKVKFYGRPNLRDLEWAFFPLWEEARGFSGFEEDDEYSCNRILLDPYITKEELLTEHPDVIRSDGEIKTYVKARDYINKIHDRNLGRPIYNNSALNLMMLGPRGFGKDVHKDTPVHTETCRKAIKLINIGDKIYGRNGKLATVTNKFKFTDQLQHRVIFADGQEVLCGLGHKWLVFDNVTKSEVRLELKDILSKYKHGSRGDSRYFVRLTAPVEYSEKNLPIDPYTLGALLGDGGITQRITLTSADKELFQYIKLPVNSIIKKDKGKFQYSIIGTVREGKNIINPVTNALKALGLFGQKSENKFIPPDYLYGSIHQRMELLRGLMDTDGFISKAGSISFTTSSEELAIGVEYLVRSLGIRCNKYKRRKTSHKDSFRVNIITSEPIFKLHRKLERLNLNPSRYAIKNRRYIAIREIIPEKVDESYCLSVDNEDSTFLVEQFLPTSNSYSVGCGIVAPEFLFDGRNKYDPGSKEKSSSVTIVGAADAKYSNDLLDKTKITLDNLPGSIEVGNKFYPSPLSKKFKGSFQPGKEISSSYKAKVGGNWKTLGSGSQIRNRTFRDNAYAIQGSRSSTVIFEEVGMFTNLRDSYNNSVDVMKEGSIKFGSAMFLGTGGDMEGGTLDAYYMFYRPEEFDMLVFEDLWENKGNIGYFVPAHYGDNAYKDEHGNTKVEIGLRKEKEMREKLGGDSGVSSTLDSYIVYHPLVPSEMFLVRNTNIFPVLELRRRREEIDQLGIAATLEKRVELYYDPNAKATGGVSYKLDVSGKLSPIKEFPYRGSDKEGALIIYELPIIEPKLGEVPSDLYIIGHDPVRTDNPDGPSLASIYVLKTKKYKYKHGHDEIVAQYVGRPFRGRNVTNELLLKLSKFYNAKVYFENTTGNVKEYFEKHHALNLLATQPKTVFTNKASFEQTGRTAIYGYPMESKKDKVDAMHYLADWLLEERGKDNNGRTVRNLDLVPDPALLDELIFFNMDGNFDRVMGFAGCIIGMEETYNQYEEDLLLSIPKTTPVVDFFNNNKTLFINELTNHNSLP